MLKGKAAKKDREDRARAVDLSSKYSISPPKSWSGKDLPSLSMSVNYEDNSIDWQVGCRPWVELSKHGRFSSLEVRNGTADRWLGILNYVIQNSLQTLVRSESECKNAFHTRNGLQNRFLAVSDELSALKRQSRSLVEVR